MVTALVILPPLVLAVVFHEVAHGWVAERLGDPTARSLGRISLNPLVHIDPVMTILLPAMLIILGSPFIFGGAKPVPINPLFFQNPRRGMFWVALAGPAVNIILASIFLILSAVSIKVFSTPAGIIDNAAMRLLVSWFSASVVINLVLAFFNLIPIPPLDGGRIAVGLLPVPLAKIVARLEPFGMFIVIFLLAAGIFEKILLPLAFLIALFEYAGWIIPLR